MPRFEDALGEVIGAGEGESEEIHHHDHPEMPGGDDDEPRELQIVPPVPGGGDDEPREDILEQMLHVVSAGCKKNKLYK